MWEPFTTSIHEWAPNCAIASALAISLLPLLSKINPVNLN
jgi:hypothetical protein